MDPELSELIELLSIYNSHPVRQSQLILYPGKSKGEIQFSFLDKWNDSSSIKIQFFSFPDAIVKVKEFLKADE